ncbi:hypothetical protein VNO80_03078 [Phaseolus coccineus]|uniref:Uncharacterized protein n=1 Tax=Phaseolus coccineus TaxID=3886 RepID=A0AAN9NW47_PHACN
MYLCAEPRYPLEGYRKEGYPPPGYPSPGYLPPGYPYSKAILHRPNPPRAILRPTLRLRLSINNIHRALVAWKAGALTTLSTAAACWMPTSEMTFALHKLNSTAFNSIKVVSLSLFPLLYVNVKQRKERKRHKFD